MGNRSSNNFANLPPPPPPTTATTTEVESSEEVSKPNYGKEGMDLIKSGRYRPVKQETLDYLNATQPGRQDIRQLTPGQALSGKEVRQWISDHEGLNLGERRKKELAQQWRFFLSCEPIQRGIDAGVVCGCIVSALALIKKSNREPLKLMCFWGAGFCFGMVTLPVMLIYIEAYNIRYFREREKALFASQREKFLNDEKNR